MKKSLLDEPHELLKLINDCLKPKKHETKKFGEVFTPIKFINENIFKDLNKVKKRIFDNENLTWYDPATGMGNFSIAVYLRLIISLKNIY